MATHMAEMYVAERNKLKMYTVEPCMAGACKMETYMAGVWMAEMSVVVTCRMETHVAEMYVAEVYKLKRCKVEPCTAGTHRRGWDVQDGASLAAQELSAPAMHASA